MIRLRNINKQLPYTAHYCTGCIVEFGSLSWTIQRSLMYKVEYCKFCVLDYLMSYPIRNFRFHSLLLQLSHLKQSSVYPLRIHRHHKTQSTSTMPTIPTILHHVHSDQPQFLSSSKMEIHFPRGKIKGSTNNVNYVRNLAFNLLSIS